MPTGYTAKIAEGQTFEDFVFAAARAMGALIMMRDDPLDAPIPDEFKPSNHHIEGLQHAKDRLAALDAMSPKEAKAAADAAFEKQTKEAAERLVKVREERAAYEAMLAQVRDWEPPTPDHVGVKDFMAEQIESSIKFDCDSTESYYAKDGAAERLSGVAWRMKEREKAEWSIAYHTKEHDGEVERAKGRTAWVKALRESLRCG